MKLKKERLCVYLLKRKKKYSKSKVNFIKKKKIK